MRRIALVGDIGSGKTFISNLFRYPIFNADLVVSNLYKKDKFLFRKVTLNNFPSVFLQNLMFSKICFSSSISFTTSSKTMPNDK